MSARASERQADSHPPRAHVAIVGAGLMGSQIGCEYALGGCTVLWSQDADGAQQRVEEALRLASTSGLAGPAELERARSLMARGDATISSVEVLGAFRASEAVKTALADRIA